VAVTTGEGDPERLRRVAELGPDLLRGRPIDLPELMRRLGHPAEGCPTNRLAGSAN
jgi:hypothetical protein